MPENYLEKRDFSRQGSIAHAIAFIENRLNNYIWSVSDTKFQLGDPKYGRYMARNNVGGGVVELLGSMLEQDFLETAERQKLEEFESQIIEFYQDHFSAPNVERMRTATEMQQLKKLLEELRYYLQQCYLKK